MTMTEAVAELREMANGRHFCAQLAVTPGCVRCQLYIEGGARYGWTDTCDTWQQAVVAMREMEAGATPTIPDGEFPATEAEPPRVFRDLGCMNGWAKGGPEYAIYDACVADSRTGTKHKYTSTELGNCYHSMTCHTCGYTCTSDSSG